MADSDDQITSLQLTDEQRRQIAEIFGDEFAERLQEIKVEKIAGFLRANMQMN